MTPTTPAAIDSRGLTKHYGSTVALDRVDFQVPTGTVFGVIGPNGAGKTTTMRLLLDIIRPTSGEVSVLGADPRSGGPSLRRRIGFLPGELHLGGRGSGRELLRHYARISGGVPADRIEQLGDRLGVDLSRPVRKLSKGNKQKVGLIQAFMHEPELLVLDEPTSGLDPLVQQEFLTMVREAKAAGQTVFLSSHVLSEVQQAADEVAILRDGRIATIATVKQLRETAVRHVRVVVAEEDAGALAATLSASPGISAIGQSPLGPAEGESEFTATIDAHVDDFVKALAQHPIIDLAIEEPELEESVMRYYDGSDAPRPTDDDEEDAR